METWRWWKHGVVYQVYPRSFYDSNGDGIGDIQGIIRKLDYCADLGIDAMWLSPINASPMHDFGYDISDYTSIDPVFGSMNDFDDLLREAHRRGIRIVMDLALNHTSHLHPWFVESSASRDNKKRNWYIWHDGIGGKPPNNWRSAFGGGAWEWNADRGQYYLHSFLKEQPDVNWRNPDLQCAMLGVLRFWLDRGVDGFRLDVANWFIKDERFRNNPFALNPFGIAAKKYSRNRPECLDIMRLIRTLTDSYEDRMTVGEVFSYPPGDPSLSARYLGTNEDGLHLTFDFSLLYQPWNARGFYRSVKKWYSSIPENGWPCNVLSNHDQPRSYNRYTDDGNADRRARVAAALLLTLRGTPFMYYGEEIGMKNFRIPRGRIADPAGKKFWPLYMGRDCARTPMQWTEGPNAGFTGGSVWLPLCVDYETVNVRSQSNDRYSLLSFYRSLISIRKNKKALAHGSWKCLVKGTGGILVYLREYNDELICVALNFKPAPRALNAGHRAQWKVVLSTHRSLNEHFTGIRFDLYPFEATIIEKIGEL